jgi:hypothetical protein
VIAEDEQVTELRVGGACCLREGLIEIEALDSLTLLADLERAQQIGDLVFVETAQSQVDTGRRLQIGQQPSEESVAPRPRDLVEG